MRQQKIFYKRRAEQLCCSVQAKWWSEVSNLLELTPVEPGSEKCLFLQRNCCTGHLCCASALSGSGQSQCRKAVPAEPEPQCPLPPEPPNPAGWEGSAIHCSAGSSCFSPHFLLALPRCQCTPISSGTVLLSPAATQLSPPEAPSLLQTPVWLCPHCSSPSPSDVPPNGTPFSRGPAQAPI